MGLTPAVAIIGCGLIGAKRARALPAGALKLVCDVNSEAASALGRQYGAVCQSDWQLAVQSPEIDTVIVSTSHDMLARIALAAAESGKHVLIEKPGARRAIELDPVREAAARSGALVRVGFNHRYHRAFRKAREIFDSGVLGEMMYVRARYGHGGRIGYDREWRAVPAISGGGEAIDQGMHLLDLAGWFLGTFTEIQGAIATCFWDMPVEDNAFFLLKTAEGAVASLHATWTEWKNMFSFEIAGKNGKLEINGLGGSYGIERLAHYQMSRDMGPPDTTIFEYPMADDSWEREWAAFERDMLTRTPPDPGVAEAQRALSIIEQLYEGRYD